MGGKMAKKREKENPKLEIQDPRSKIGYLLRVSIAQKGWRSLIWIQSGMDTKYVASLFQVLLLNCYRFFTIIQN